jgi:hypothetical protein
MNTPEDVRVFPQDMNVYAGIIGRDKLLMGAAEQRRRDTEFNRLFFAPWDMVSTSVRRADVVSVFRRPRGYKADGSVWTHGEWNQMEANAHLSDFPSQRKQAIVLRAADLRELPTHEPRFAKPTPDSRVDPFDYFQYSLLPPGTPLFVAHATADGLWFYVECAVASGWVYACDIAPVDADFKRAYKTGAYAALVRDNVRLADTLAGVGAIFPTTSGENSRSLRILYPVRGAGGMARIDEIVLGDEDAALKPLPFTAGNAARVGNAMMSQHYGWGGMFGNRDCSALIRDILAPFGIWLPRNSSAQARRGIVHPLGGMSVKEKEHAVLTRGTPFASLVGMKGHIMLYVGKYKGRAAVFHNVWGLRVVEGSDDNARFVIGRAVVTSLTPGMELGNLYRDVTLADRVGTLTNLTDNAY